MQIEKNEREGSEGLLRIVAVSTLFTSADVAWWHCSSVKLGCTKLSL